MQVCSDTWSFSLNNAPSDLSDAGNDPMSMVGTQCISPHDDAGNTNFSGDYIEIDGKNTPAII